MLGVWKPHYFTISINSLTTDQNVVFPHDFPVNHHVSYSIIDDSLVCINEISGVEEYSLSRNGVQRIFLPGIHVSRTFSDRAGNVWFTTIGNGLYRLYSDAFMTIHLTGKRDWSVFGPQHQLKPGGGSTNDPGINHNVIFPFTYPGLLGCWHVETGG